MKVQYVLVFMRDRADQNLVIKVIVIVCIKVDHHHLALVAARVNIGRMRMRSLEISSRIVFRGMEHGDGQAGVTVYARRLSIIKELLHWIQHVAFDALRERFGAPHRVIDAGLHPNQDTPRQTAQFHFSLPLVAVQQKRKSKRLSVSERVFRRACRRCMPYIHGRHAVDGGDIFEGGQVHARQGCQRREVALLRQQRQLRQQSDKAQE